MNTAIDTLLDDYELVLRKDGKVMPVGLWFKEDCNPKKDIQAYQPPITDAELKAILPPLQYALHVLTKTPYRG